MSGERQREGDRKEPGSAADAQQTTDAKPSSRDELEPSGDLRAVGSSEQIDAIEITGAVTAAERAAVVQDVELTLEQRKRFVEMRRLVRRGDAYAIMNIEPGASRREVDTALARLGREFDLAGFGRKRMGSFGDWLGDILEGINAAYMHLCFDSPMPKLTVDAEPSAQTPLSSVEVSRKLRAITPTLDEIAGKAPVDVPADVYGDAHRALSSGNLSVAEELAKSAVDKSPDIETLRLLSEVYKRKGLYKKAASILSLAQSMCRDRKTMRALHHDVRALHALMRGEDS